MLLQLRKFMRLSEREVQMQVDMYVPMQKTVAVDPDRLTD